MRDERVGYPRRGRTVLGEKSVRSGVGTFAFRCSRGPGVRSERPREVLQ